MVELRKLRLSSSGELLRNLLALSISGIGTKAIVFFVLLLLARRLGVDDFGKVNFAQTVINYLIVLASFGIPVLAVRTLAGQGDNFREEVGEFLSTQFVTGGFAFVILVAVIGLLPKSGEDKLLIALFSLNLLGSTFLIDWAFRAQEQMMFVAVGNLIQTLVPLVLIALFVQSEAQLLLVPVFLAAGLWGRNILYWQRFIRDYGLPRLDFRRDKVIDLLRRASILGISAIMIQIYYSVDTLLLGLMRSDTEVGWYNAAYRVVLLFTMLGGIVGEVIFPRLSRQSTQLDVQQKSRNMLLGAKLLLYGSLPVALAGTLYSSQLMTLLFGSTYANGAPALQILIWQVFTVFCNVSFAYHLLAAEKNRLYFISVTAGAVINLSLNLLLIPAYGLVGAAITTIIAEVVVLSLLYIFATRAIAPVPMLIPFLKAVIAGGVFVAIALYNQNLWHGLVLSALGYSVVLLATSPFAGDEIRRLLPWRIHESG
jgi:O-antigen/teichoic acid export membrane protein